MATGSEEQQHGTGQGQAKRAEHGEEAHSLTAPRTFEPTLTQVFSRACFKVMTQRKLAKPVSQVTVLQIEVQQLNESRAPSNWGFL